MKCKKSNITTRVKRQLFNFCSLLLITLISSPLYAQKLTINDLQTLCGMKNWESVNHYMLNKGWAYYESSKGSLITYNTITWAYELGYDEKAPGWFYLYTYEGLPNKIDYTVVNINIYNSIQQSLSKNGYKLIDSEIKNNELVTNYENTSFSITITTEKRNQSSYFSESITAYSFSLVKKGGVYDPNNGPKKNYWYDGYQIKEEFVLKSGKLHGEYTSYYSNGKPEFNGHYLNGEKHGDFIEYNSNGLKSFEYSVKDGKLNGPYKSYYSNGKIEMSGSFLGGEKHGKFIDYNEAGIKTFSYSMKDGELHGEFTKFTDSKIESITNYVEGVESGSYTSFSYKTDGKINTKTTGKIINDVPDGYWEMILFLNESETEIMSFFNWTNGIKNGPFKETSIDSVVYGNYYMDLLNGDYSVHIPSSGSFSISKKLESDTSKMCKSRYGQWLNGKKSGYWKYYNYGNLMSEGRYVNDQKSGVWKSYKYADYSDKTERIVERLNNEESIGDIIETSNYSNGKLDGESRIFGYVQSYRELCQKYALDSCTFARYLKIDAVANYKLDKLEGWFLLKDSVGNLISNGLFKNDKKEGIWEDYFKDNETQLTYLVKSSYIAGELSGEFTKYHPNGVIYSEGEFIQDLRTGKWNFYNELGEILVTENYFRNQLHGLYSVYNDNQNIIQQFEYSHGRLTNMFQYNPLNTSELIIEHEIIEEFDDKYITRRKDYYSDSTIICDYEVMKNNIDWVTNDSKKVGKYEKYLNEKLIISGTYYSNRKNNYWLFYYREQDVVLEVNYIANVKMSESYSQIETKLPYNGKIIVIDTVNKTKEIRKIKDGKRDGKTIIYDSNGKKIGIEKYDSGILL